MAVASSSKNCRDVLQRAGIENLFEAVADRLVAATAGLKDKPEPDIFIKAAESLRVDISRTVVVEDSSAGVEAGQAGDFGMVLEVAKRNNSALLRERGADHVVEDLEEIILKDMDRWFFEHGSRLPSALDCLGKIQGRISHKRAVVFLDYDGTLTPIVDRPELAVMSGEMREVLRELAASCTTAVVSGRARTKVQDFVGVEDLIYAGSHGFDIAGPNGPELQHEEGRRYSPAIDSALRQISEKLSGIQGALVEHTGISISVHYRLVPEEQVPLMEKVVDQTLKNHPTLRKTHGKKVFELRPDMDWDKGKAVLWILRALGLEETDVVPFYLGDDTTDEDAFREVRDKGVGILVAETPRPTAATHRLRDVQEVRRFLQALTAILKQKHS